MTKKQILSLIASTIVFRDNKDHKSGASCLYIPLNGRIGIKCYNERSNRDFAFKTQTTLAKFKLSPITFFSFECFYGYQRKFCYVTQHVKKPTRGQYKEKVDEFKEALRKLNIDLYDICRENSGFYKNKLLLIDCDKGTVTAWKNKRLRMLKGL